MMGYQRSRFQLLHPSPKGSNRSCAHPGHDPGGPPASAPGANNGLVSVSSLMLGVGAVNHANPAMVVSGCTRSERGKRSPSAFKRTMVWRSCRTRCKRPVCLHWLLLWAVCSGCPPVGYWASLGADGSGVGRVELRAGWVVGRGGARIFFRGGPAVRPLDSAMA
ncbi:hypothetical protein EJ110_NYTH16594 [Nymphaea thermarum]|nr:hypothetical protein EJ110_NYTH16594 [Nymphaea thermarum]